MKRIIDKPYGIYSTFYGSRWSEIDVKCPQCGKLAIVTARYDLRFSCTNCGKSDKTGGSEYDTVCRYDVHNQCEHCGRHYRVDITDETKHKYPALHVACPYCKHVMQGKVQKHKNEGWWRWSGGFRCRIHDGREPWFGCELWFLSYFDGKPVWALNREHLAYLIDYIDADLREKPAGFQLRTQADQLPTFMKTAKNRERMVKLLKKMQEQ